MIPRTECAYLSLRRNYAGRSNRRPTFSHIAHQQRLEGLKQSAQGIKRHQNKAFLRSTERNFVQVKDPNVIPFNLRLKKLAKDRNWRGALNCIQEIHKQGLRPDEISYATAIDACSKSFKSREAVKLFEEMKQVGIRPNVPIYNAVMNACARDHQWKQSLGFLQDMRANGIIPNIVSYNVCLSALEKSKKWSIAVDLMKDIQASGVPLQSITYNTVISACAKSRKMGVCEELHTQMIADGFVPDVFTYSSLLNGYRKVRNWDCIFRIADEMRARNVHFDAVIYSTMIGACADAGESDRAFGLFGEMKANGIHPNEIVYSCILRACNNVETVDKIFDEMKSKRIKKNSVVFTSAINVAKEYGLVQDATRWFDQMLNEGIKPDWVAFMSLFEVLNQSNDASLLDTYYQKGMELGVLSHFAKENDPNGSQIVVDLHGWSTALARAALRNLMQEAELEMQRSGAVRGLKIYTGKGYSKNTPVLRPAVTRMLQSEFNPALSFRIEQGAVHISPEEVSHWVRSQNKQFQQGSLSFEEFISSDDISRLSIHYSALETPLDGIDFEEDLTFIPPTHIPRFALRFSEDDPLYWTHGLFGRDDSPPPTYIATVPKMANREARV